MDTVLQLPWEHEESHFDPTPVPTLSKIIADEFVLPFIHSFNKDIQSQDWVLVFSYMDVV